MTSARTSRVWCTIPLIITIFSLSLPAYAQYSGGTGEPNDPYQIATAEDLMLLGETPEDYDKHFIMTADIDLDPNLPGRKVFDRAVISPDVNNTNSVFDGIPFSGIFNGNDHVIRNVDVNMQGRGVCGLFGYLGKAGQIKNMGVQDASIVARYYIGGLVGRNYGSISNCYSTGSVSGTDWIVGGLVGENRGCITASYSNALVSGGNHVGGLVGTNARGSIATSYSTGSASGTELVGGLVGFNDLGSSITNCYSTASVSGEWAVGGLVGEIGNRHVGAWDGDDCVVTHCYSGGEVSGMGGPIGGLVGLTYENADVFDSFWDMETSGQATSDGGTGKTMAEMQAASTFLDAGWDFMGETVNGSEDLWKIAEGLGYPFFAWEKYSGGTGEPNDPYQIATAEDLMLLGETPEDYDKHFILTTDIDLDPNLPGRKVFDRAVIAPHLKAKSWYNFDGIPFSGVFDGGGHTISHLTITGGTCLGLFGQVGSTAIVSNLGLEAVEVSGAGFPEFSVGGLAGTNSGNVRQCYSNGIVSGYGPGANVGGLVGINKGAATDCHSSATAIGNCECRWCTFDGTVTLAGLVGWNYWQGTVIRCYSTGFVDDTGEDCLSGGLVGWGLYEGKVAASFWDIKSSGQTVSGGGTGKTTSEIQMAGTFLDAGWDFVDETENGTDDIWWILEGQDYPRLWWESAEE